MQSASTSKPLRVFPTVFLGTLIIKVLLAWKLPVVGDEAYYISWGKHLAGGYYDLPPMIGWWLGLLQMVGSHPVWLRLPAILLSSVVAWVIHSWLMESGDERSEWAASAYLLTPIHLLPVVMSTDTPLILFSILAIFTLWKASRTHSTPLYFLSGVLLGGAFLAKYFALLLMPVALAYGLWAQREKKYFRGLFISLAGLLPFVLQHLYWNSRHCWVNFVFNFHTRHTGGGVHLDFFRNFWLFQLYLIGPVFLFFLPRMIRAGWRSAARPAHRFWFLFFLLPIAAFGWTSLFEGTGIHWYLTYYPFFFLLAGALLDSRDLRRATAWTGAWGTLHFAVVLALLVMPLSFWKERLTPQKYRDWVFHTRTAEVIDAFKAETEKFHPVTDGYSIAAVAGYGLGEGKDFSVFGAESKFGRNDDFVTDYRALDRRDFIHFARGPQDVERFKPFFDRVETSSFEVEGAEFFLLKGYGFKFPEYRDRFMRGMVAKYYPRVWSDQGCSVREAVQGSP